MRCLTNTFLTCNNGTSLNSLNELNRIKQFLNNQLDRDYRKSVWSPFVCGDVESVKVQTVPKNMKKSKLWAMAVWIDWTEYRDSHGRL